MKLRMTSAILAACFAGTTGVAETRGAYLMGAMGDSISAATLADGHAKASDREESEPVIYARGFINPPNWVPFMGHMENKATLSWASGTKIPSHFQRLKQYVSERLDGSLTMMNVSVPGEKTKGMVEQAEALVTAMKSGKYEALTYVTLLIGANDACQGTSDDAMAAELKATFDKLATIQQGERIRILVSAMPRIPELGRPEITQMRTVAGMTCGYLRDQVLKECPDLTVWKTADEYDKRIRIVETKNEIIERAARDAANTYRGLDIVFSRTLYVTPIRPQYMAADCFHPDDAGHTTLSAELWGDHAWFR